MATKADYGAERLKCKEFLENYASAYDNADGPPTKKYMLILQEISNRTRRTLDVDMDDLVAHSKDEELHEAVRLNTRRYMLLFSEAADELLPPPTADARFNEDVFDVLMRQRIEQGEDAANGDARQRLPAELQRRYEVYFRPAAKAASVALREVRAEHIGQLVRVQGLVTRATDVRPLLSVATYTCEECGFEIYQEVTAQSYTPVLECPSTRCKENNSPGQLYPQTRGSKFTKFQEVKLQEMADQVPMGHIPRTLTVHVKGELTRHMAPGDVVSVAGVFLPVPYTGFKAMKAGLVANTYLEATAIHRAKKSYTEHVVTPAMRERVHAFAAEGDVYGRLARSIAPEIFGHEDVKKALLMQLVGGVTRSQPDGLTIRGDVHLCLMGDPGVAKSQLLKQIVSIAPRGVYTTGRGSSGVGLTAAVHRDPVTSEMVLEGGALVLADMGLCAIDEFDKMEEGDRTAIHEVMEQQTVSIAKAGITTTLNARTAVLAAANPAWGRWDARKTPSENIALPAALLSRFDLMWLILDKADADTDSALARHVLSVHQSGAPPPLGFLPLDGAALRAYVGMARKLNPCFPRDLTEYVATAYADMRAEEAAASAMAKTTYTMARTLLSILRLSQALARLRFSDEVAQSDVDEALRLMRMSKASLEKAAESRKAGADPVSEVYAILRDYAAAQRTGHVAYSKAVELVTQKGGSVEALVACLEEYSGLNVWFLDDDQNITFNDEHAAF